MDYFHMRNKLIEAGNVARNTLIEVGYRKERDRIAEIDEALTEVQTLAGHCLELHERCGKLQDALGWCEDIDSYGPVFKRFE